MSDVSVEEAPVTVDKTVDFDELPNVVTDKIKSAFALRVRIAMAVKQMTYFDVAMRCGVSRQAAWLWAQGGTMPGSARLQPICEAFGCSLSWLLSTNPIDLGEGGPK